MARRPDEPTNSNYFCCQDHFNLKEDMENYVRFALMGGPIKMKKNVVPHIFDCQSDRKRCLSHPRPTSEKRRRKADVADLLATPGSSSFAEAASKENVSPNIKTASEGCLKPVKIIIPRGSILDPSETAAVVGGNVLTSQRVVDVVLTAFNACAASQGCMNNVTLGTEKWGYYETVAGGSGAGPTWHGRGGVHTHMTNTRITDLEILEQRYPVILKRFSLRSESGGDGAYRGGDGVVREILFRTPMTLSVLTERRSHNPPGLDGGLPGARGRNTLSRADGRKINLGPKTAVAVQSGDAFLLESPGGGGYGSPGSTTATTAKVGKAFVERGSVFEYRKAQESV